MSVKFQGEKSFPLVYCVGDETVSVLFDSYAVNEAYDVVAGDPEKWMTGDQWEQLTGNCSRFIADKAANTGLPKQMRLSSDTLKSIIQDVPNAD